MRAPALTDCVPPQCSAAAVSCRSQDNADPLASCHSSLPVVLASSWKERQQRLTPRLCPCPVLTSDHYCRYQRHLRDVHANLPAGLKEFILTLNNGPAWTRARWAYDLYNSSVFETASNEWEKPPGLGICALDQLYQLCDHIANWHALGDKNVVVSHLAARIARSRLWPAACCVGLACCCADWDCWCSCCTRGA